MTSKPKPSLIDQAQRHVDEIQRHANEMTDLVRQYGLYTTRTERWGMLLIETFQNRLVITTESDIKVQVDFNSETKILTPSGAFFDAETWELIQKIVKAEVA